MDIQRAPRRLFPSRPGRLSAVADGKIYPLGAGVARQVGVVLLLFKRLSLHHQDYSSRGTQVFAIDSQGLSSACQEQSTHSALTLLWPSQG
jgi:hypothetical protein